MAIRPTTDSCCKLVSEPVVFSLRSDLSWSPRPLPRQDPQKFRPRLFQEYCRWEEIAAITDTWAERSAVDVSRSKIVGFKCRAYLLISIKCSLAAVSFLRLDMSMYARVTSFVIFASYSSTAWFSACIHPNKFELLNITMTVALFDKPFQERDTIRAVITFQIII